MESNFKCLIILVATCLTVATAIPIRMKMQDGKPVLVRNARFGDFDNTPEEIRIANVPLYHTPKPAKSSLLKPSPFGGERTEGTERFGSTGGKSHESLRNVADPEDRFFALMKRQRLTQAIHRLEVAKEELLMPSVIHKRRIRKHEL